MTAPSPGSASIDATLLHQLVEVASLRSPDRPSLTYGGVTLDYSTLANRVSTFATGLMAIGLNRSERVGIYLEKRVETVVAMFGTAAGGGVFVPINPLLKAEQVAYILRDCNVRVLVTSPERLSQLDATLQECPDLRHIIVTSSTNLPAAAAVPVHLWSDWIAFPSRTGHRVIDDDMAAILYTSGSTGKPKGVVLSHRNMVAGAKSVASYLENCEDDTLLAVLPLSFDAGLSQLTTAFHANARVVLLNHLLPIDVIKALAQERITGLTAVPPLYIQLSQLEWPATIQMHLRYFANTGGRMPLETLKALRAKVPAAKPFLMYGLTEAFRSTYLPPSEVDKRPDSIGKAIPNAEILVLREDGTPCAANESGELVHRGALVGMGYWNDPEKTAERYKPLPGREAGLVLPELAVFSGDTVRRDDEGFLYFIGRRDEMIKTSGYRVSPTEIEEVLYATQLVGEVAAFGVPHPTLGQGVVVVATPSATGSLDETALLAVCRARLPAFMVPAKIDIRPGPLPRNPNGKIDRKTISGAFLDYFARPQ
jgi:acyl-CoA ligase (AMP-forming) (exosortase A-associated)